MFVRKLMCYITLLLLLLNLVYLYVKIQTLPYLEAKIEKIIDGDTILVTSNNNTYSVRFAGIDCFESHYNKRVKYQSKNYDINDTEVIEKGKKAKSILTNTLSDTDTIYLIPYGVDKYGRMIAIPYKSFFLITKINLSNYMRNTGYCPYYMWKPK